jgi:uncharacterized RDD family membrane protein YckC
MELPMILTEPTPRVYARLGPRLKAVVRDFVVYAAGLGVIVLCSSLMPPGPLLTGTIIGLFVALLLYEPVLVTWGGGTIGHRSLNLRVVRARDGGRVGFIRALFRSSVKAVTGLLGFLAIELTRRHQGLHDLAAGTVVVPRSEVSDIEGFAPARAPQPAILPSRLRRTTVTGGYLLLLFALLAAVAAVVYSEDCLLADRCNEVERLADLVIGSAFFAVLAVLIVAGGKGYLPGARRKRPAAVPDPGRDGAV